MLQSAPLKKNAFATIENRHIVEGGQSGKIRRDRIGNLQRLARHRPHTTGHLLRTLDHVRDIRDLPLYLGTHLAEISAASAVPNPNPSKIV